MASQPAPSSSQGVQSRKRPLPQQATPDDSDVLEVYHSKEIIDRSSTFIGAFSPTASPRTLQSLPSFKSASHRILAWRQRGRNQQSTLTGPPRVRYDLGHDDDGEKYGGKRAERVLDEMKVEGAVVVARWYGGVLLGPVRFAHIENCAREAVNAWQESQSTEAEIVSGSDPKKRRLESSQPISHEQVEDFRSKDELIKVLRERDESVKVLRGLLAEKQGKSPSKTSQAPKYDDMSVVALQRLEKARDSTLAWILKEIDKAESATTN